MYALLALVATALTSLLPILYKRLLRDASPARVAWAVNAASLPLLAMGTLLLTQCYWAAPRGLACSVQMLHVEGVFLAALVGSAVLNWGATLFSTWSLATADASLVAPLLTLNPAFTLLVAWLTLGERPDL